MLLYEFNEDMTGGFAAGSIGIGGANRNVKFKGCPRTSAVVCECSKVMSLTESMDKVIAQCIITESSGAQGHVLFIQQPGTPTLIKGVVNGLTPGKHGFHIHEFGDLSNGCESTGGHYNPHDVAHGDVDEGHVGDLGNITADENGVAKFTIVASRIELMGELSIVGRAVVIHADVDDLGESGDEAGNSGERVAAGVIALRDQGADEVTEGHQETLNPPSIDVGDEVKTGKFRNVKATVKGFKKDDHNQPVLKTTKGDKKLFSLRLSKLQQEEAPPGREDQVKALKGKVDNPYAVAWASYNKSK